MYAKYFLPIGACFLSVCVGQANAAAAPPTPAVAPPSMAAAARAPAIAIETVAEKTLARLPDGRLYWRIETFPNPAAAQAAVGPTGLAAQVSGRSWLFTLAPHGGHTSGAAFVAEVGPVPALDAPSYLLRINHATGAPGATTPVHFHAGSEAFYVLSGQLSQRTPKGVMQVDAGHSMNGHAPGTVMQLTSSGKVNLDQLVMFVVDATKPFSTPASFH